MTVRDRVAAAADPADRRGGGSVDAGAVPAAHRARGFRKAARLRGSRDRGDRQPGARGPQPAARVARRRYALPALRAADDAGAAGDGEHRRRLRRADDRRDRDRAGGVAGHGASAARSAAEPTRVGRCRRRPTAEPFEIDRACMAAAAPTTYDADDYVPSEPSGGPSCARFATEHRIGILVFRRHVGGDGRLFAAAAAGRRRHRARSASRCRSRPASPSTPSPGTSPTREPASRGRAPSTSRTATRSGSRSAGCRPAPATRSP